MSLPHRRYSLVLLALFLALAVPLGIDPIDRQDWLLENALVALFIGLLVFLHRHLVFSRLSYTLIFLFLCLHEIGSHYTYSKVPYDEWCRALSGRTFNSFIGWERNNFDRIIHFLYGLLLAYPIREIFLRVANVRGFWGYFLPLDLTMSTSMLYELIEWAAAEFFGGDLGAAYIGAQGDVWDSQKDMALATLGAVVAMCLTAFINGRYQRDFAREWTESLRVMGKLTLGEDEMARMRKVR